MPKQDKMVTFCGRLMTLEEARNAMQLAVVKRADPSSKARNMREAVDDALASEEPSSSAKSARSRR